MKLLNSKLLIVVLGWLVFYGCSDQEKFAGNAKQFEGRTFVSETYGKNLKATLLFMENSNLVVKNIPFGIHFSKPYQILMSNESPSGRPTINVESNYYFIIKDQDTLIYRYYIGPSEKTIVFKSLD